MISFLIRDIGHVSAVLVRHAVGDNLSPPVRKRHLVFSARVEAWPLLLLTKVLSAHFISEQQTFKLRPASIIFKKNDGMDEFSQFKKFFIELSCETDFCFFCDFSYY